MYLSTREREAGRGEVQNRSWLLSEFKDSLGYIRRMVVLQKSEQTHMFIWVCCASNCIFHIGVGIVTRMRIWEGAELMF